MRRAAHMVTGVRLSRTVCVRAPSVVVVLVLWRRLRSLRVCARVCERCIECVVARAPDRLHTNRASHRVRVAND